MRAGKQKDCVEDTDCGRQEQRLVQPKDLSLQPFILVIEDRDLC